ncbi:MAG: site-specific DNA-methyltransferase [Muribaculaceae bacterium]|nr:site-specific DNA-methyltransferase [Muribaculaceae bacterium]
MAKKIKHNPYEPTLDLGLDGMNTVSEKETGPVTVLGMTFPNDEERRAYFREQLRAKLPELRNIDGFPIGSDDDIINLSDPPYYTACPNPWLNDFIAEWEQEKLQLEAEGKRHPNVVVNEPYAADVSEGKSNPVYTAHTYHTKVPHPAIMRYILKYTQPGDIILDGFAGTGMTGVAATGVTNSSDNYLQKLLKEFDNAQVGLRHAICGDLSPYASSISYFYNSPLDFLGFKREVEQILKEIKE